MAALGFPAHDSFVDEPDRGAIWNARLHVVAVTLLPAAALLMVARRASGALRLPLSTADAVVCGLVLAIVSAGYRAALVRFRPQVSPVCFHYLQWAPTVSVLAICGALSLPRTSAAALAALWSIVAVGELSPLVGFRFLRQGGERRSSPLAGSSLRRVRQQLTRFSDAAGRDVVEGTVVARFAAGQRTASVHLVFCPPFDRAPEIACGAAGDVTAEVKAAQSLAYAARFDVKLAVPSAEAIDVPVSFSARCNG